MTKKEARKFFRQQRQALSSKDMERFNDLILLQFQKISLPFLDYVHSYIPSEKLAEPDTSLILRYLIFKFPGLKIAAPKVDIQTLRMQHYHVTEFDTLEQNIYGIEEPASGALIATEDIDLVIVPLLAFDLHGSRAGYGKGYYDRFLPDCRNDVMKVGLSFFEPVEKLEDVDQYDVSLDFCCTPEKLYCW